MSATNPYAQLKNTTDCFGNSSISPKVQEALAKSLNQVYKFYHGWLCLPLASIGFVLTLIYICAVYSAIRQHRVSRKCYVLLLNRAIGDVLACVIAFMIIFYVLLLADEVNKNVMQLLDVFFVGSFWSSMVSYVSLSVLKVYAIAKPLDYRKKVTMKKCIHLMLFSWFIFLIMTTYAASVTALVKIPVLNMWSGCKLETCLRTMYRLRNLTTAIVYFFTIFCFLLTVVLVRKAQRLASFFHQKSANINSSIQKKKNRFPLWKLAINVGTFSVFNLFYVIWAIGLLLNTDRCFFLRNFTMMMRFLGMIRSSLLLRIVMDPILSFITDLQIKRSALSLFGISGQVFPFMSFRKDIPSEEENSSECVGVSRETKLSAESMAASLRQNSSAVV